VKTPQKAIPIILSAPAVCLLCVFSFVFVCVCVYVCVCLCVIVVWAPCVWKNVCVWFGLERVWAVARQVFVWCLAVCVCMYVCVCVCVHKYSCEEIFRVCVGVCVVGVCMYACMYVCVRMY